MNILLSAYACEPNRGSEPAVGWNWVFHLCEKGHKVYVLTRENNKEVIEKALPLQNVEIQPSFVYFDLPKWLMWWKKGTKGVYFYYLFWQIGIYFIARKLCRLIQFDYVHHITFVNARQPSFLGYLGVPFIFGPVSGGERAPFRLRKSFPLQGWLKDLLRDCMNWFVRYDPLMQITFKQAKRIYTTSESTKALIPSFFHHKTYVQLAIGVNSNFTKFAKSKIKNKKSGFNILYTGNLLYLKGLHLALKAFSEFYSNYPDSYFTLIGNGPEKEWLQKLASNLHISEHIVWIPHLPQNELQAQYPLYDVFLFPSLHDSGGLVILEAMMHGLPVIALDIGGPGIIVDNSCGRVISTIGRTETQVISDLADALHLMAKDPGQRKLYGEGARARIAEFEWARLIQSIYNEELIFSENLPKKPFKSYAR